MTARYTRNAAGLGTTTIRMVMQREEKQGRAWQERFQWPEARSVKRQAPGAPAFPSANNSQRPTRCASTSTDHQLTDPGEPCGQPLFPCRVSRLPCPAEPTDQLIARKDQQAAAGQIGGLTRALASRGDAGWGHGTGPVNCGWLHNPPPCFRPFSMLACPFWRPQNSYGLK